MGIIEKGGAFIPGLQNGHTKQSGKCILFFSLMVKHMYNVCLTGHRQTVLINVKFKPNHV